VYSNYFPLNISPKPKIIINNNLTGKHLIVDAKSLGAAPSWYRAGYLHSIFDESGIVDGATIKKHFCRLGTTYVELSDLQFLNSFLFQPVPWLIDITLKVWSTADLNIYNPIERIEQKINSLNDFDIT
jgi:hypothetical protein